MEKIGNRTIKYFLNKRRRSYFFEDWMNKLKSKNSISNMLRGLNKERNKYKKKYLFNMKKIYAGSFSKKYLCYLQNNVIKAIMHNARLCKTFSNFQQCSYKVFAS